MNDTNMVCYVLRVALSRSMCDGSVEVNRFRPRQKQYSCMCTNLYKHSHTQMCHPPDNYSRACNSPDNYCRSVIHLILQQTYDLGDYEFIRHPPAYYFSALSRYSRVSPGSLAVTPQQVAIIVCVSQFLLITHLTGASEQG